MTMSSGLKLVEVDRSEGRSWVEKSLREGHRLSAAVLAARALEKGRFLMVVPDGFQRAGLDFAIGGVTSARLVEEALGRFLDDLRQRGAGCVVVEDEFLRSVDPAVVRSRDPVAVVGGRVIRWCELGGGGSECARMVNRSSSGYPLNAFVCRRTFADLGLEDRQEVSEDLTRLMVHDLVAVLVAAFDAESFLIWIADAGHAPI